ncbi:MAG: MFS transporter [Alphaproteobacteria bacterium]|nr:MFS transporter [Alphaproteobacteria bacterium]
MTRHLSTGSTLEFYKSQWRFLLFGFLLAFFSSPGQTFFISLFSGQIRDALDLSHGDFGTIYAIGTLASAATLIPLGRLVDTIKLRVIALAIVLGLALAAVHFSFISSVLTLTLGIYLLRLSGQGMMSHLYATAMTRRYVAERGRALSIAVFGHPVSEFLMPLFAIGLMMLLDWRQVWQATALLVLVVMIPATLILTRRREGQDGGGVDAIHSGRDGKQWTRRDMLLHWRFWMLSGLVLSPSFTSTGLFFHQIYFVEIKSIALSQWVSGYGFFAVLSIISSFVGGFLVDRFTASRIAPLAVSMLSLAVLMLYFTTPGVMVYLYFTVYGIAQGIAYTAVTPIWAEIYGTKHLGGIKAIAQSMMVFASALSPVTLGLMIDAGFSFGALMLVLGIIPLIAGAMAVVATRAPK